MINLLKETKEILEKHGYTLKDIKAVQGKDIAISVDHFLELANKEYDDGYGGIEVAADLVIILKDDSWLERHEYDGSEWWEYKKTPSVIPIDDESVVSLFAYRNRFTDTYAYADDGLKEMNKVIINGRNKQH